MKCKCLGVLNETLDAIRLEGDKAKILGLEEAIGILRAHYALEDFHTCACGGRIASGVCMECGAKS